MHAKLIKSKLKIHQKSDQCTVQGLPFEAIDRSLSLIDRLNTRQAIKFSIAY